MSPTPDRTTVGEVWVRAAYRARECALLDRLRHPDRRATARASRASPGSRTTRLSATSSYSPPPCRGVCARRSLGEQNADRGADRRDVAGGDELAGLAGRCGSGRWCRCPGCRRTGTSRSDRSRSCAACGPGLRRGRRPSAARSPGRWRRSRSSRGPDWRRRRTAPPARPRSRPSSSRPARRPRAASRAPGARRSAHPLVVVAERRDGHVGLAVDVRIAAARVKRQVARRRAGVKRPERRVVRHQLARARRRAGRSSSCRCPCRRRGRAGRADRRPRSARAARSGSGPGPDPSCCCEVRHRPQLSVGVDRQDRDGAMFVVGHQHPAARWIAAQVAGLAAQAGLMTQLSVSCPVASSMLERGHPAALEAHALADGEQESTLRIEGQERRIVDRDGVQEREFAAVADPGGRRRSPAELPERVYVPT